MPTSGAARSGSHWTFVTNHLLVLLRIAEDPRVRMSEIADRLDLSERSVQGIVGELVEAGYLSRTREGRRNHYEIASNLPLRHLETQHRQLGELLALLSEDRQP